MRWPRRHWTHLSIVWGASWSHFWFLPLTASRSGRSWCDACIKTGATPNSSWTTSLHAVIEFVRNLKALCRPTGSPREPTEGGSRRTWTFAAVTSRTSRLASPLWSPTSGRAPPKGTSKTTTTRRCRYRDVSGGQDRRRSL